MQDLARYIEAHSGEAVTLEILSARAHLSRQYLQRRFKAVIGVSPKEYHESCRMRKLKASLRQQRSVTHTVYEVGFGSPSRVYERLNTRLGMTPAQYRSRGKGIEISYANASTPLGEVMMGATDRGICFIQFGESEQELLVLCHSLIFG